MKKVGVSRTINFILIITGGIIAISTENEGPYGIYIILLGAMMLMIGLYRTSRNIPSRTNEEPEKQDYILDDDFDDSVDIKDEDELNETK